MAGKILIIRGGAIGDFILTLPVFAALRSHLPKASLHVLGYRHIAQLALAAGLAEDVRPIDARPLAGFFARKGDLAPELQEYFASFAVIVSYLYDPDGIFEANIARCSKAQFIAGPHRPDDRAGLHATEVFLKPLERLAVFDADPLPRLVLDHPSPSLHQFAVHPGSGSERKNWPEHHWAALLDRLIHETDARLLLVGGEAEGERLATERVDLALRLPLTDLAHRLASCRAFAGHDSGITHLAGALGVPGLVLWGETVRAVWAPRNPGLKILASKDGLAGLQTGEVFAALKMLLA
jgi:heptosyltransferase III